jgi:hypothetical protein
MLFHRTLGETGKTNPQKGKTQMTARQIRLETGKKTG